MEEAVNPTGGTVTISIGVSRYPDHGKDVYAFLKEADKALYHAKNHGRNQTCVPDAGSPEGFYSVARATASLSQAAR